MKWLDGLWIALSMYSVIPAPRRAWDEKGMGRALLWLPAVGVIIGGALFVWQRLCVRGIGIMLFSAVSTTLPALVTGGIHLDGYLDTVDALASQQDIEKRLQILKDARVGAFAVIYAGVYFLLSFGLFAQIGRGSALAVVCVGYAFSRSLAALTALRLKSARKDGLLVAFTKGYSGHMDIIIAAMFAVLMVAVSPIVGGMALVLCVLWTLLYRRVAYAAFGGVTGDTTGFFLQICELLILLAACVGSVVL